MGKFSETRSSGRSTSAHNRPLSVILRNSVTIDMSPSANTTLVLMKEKCWQAKEAPD